MDRPATRQSSLAVLIFTAILLSTALIISQGQAAEIDDQEITCEQLDSIYGIVWCGNDSMITFEQLAAYCAPILWFSPDEPLLMDTKGPNIMIPEAFPFEEQLDRPVAYYRIRTIVKHSRSVGSPISAEKDHIRNNNTLIDLSQITGVKLDFFFYYHAEEGMGRHDHDVESVEMVLLLGGPIQCDTCRYGISIQRVVAKAHGILWYDNTLDVGQYSKFPMTILVEEGKHASCTDKNSDGYYTPGYDVNRRINDAWGVRDIIRSGGLFSGGFQAWMAKVRHPEHRVFPPLPEDSPLRAHYSEDGPYADGYAQYELRPFPHWELAKDDPKLIPFIEDKGDTEWPEVIAKNDLKALTNWFTDEGFGKSWAIALRGDGNLGFSVYFPLFIFRNFEDPVGGGWIVNRIYLKDHGLRDIAWTPLYTTSASRWIDGYFSAGVEWDNDGTTTKSHFVAETGTKLRVNLKKSPLKFLTKLGTDFWGLRVGIKYTDGFEIKKLDWVLEFGAGIW
jgi:hypothetical protein